MTLQAYTHEELAIARQFMSPDAFFYIVADAISSKTKLSAVGFGDGERAVMMHSRGAGKTTYLDNPAYLKEYGLLGANLPKIGEALFAAAERCDYFCPLISGVSMENFDCIRIVKRRYQYVERLFPYAWYYMGREKEIMKTPYIAVVCRNAMKVAEKLCAKYGTKTIQAIEYGGHTDIYFAMEDIAKSAAQLVLCSVGQSGKLMIVEAANRTGKVILDVGSAMINKWQE